jgi:predicted helicase
MTFAKAGSLQSALNGKSQNRQSVNDWSEDSRYILDLVKRIVQVSLETVKIVNSLPTLNELNLEK